MCSYPREYEADLDPQLGVVVGLLSTSIQSIGLTLQRKSHLLEEEKEDHYERRPAYKRRRWQVSGPEACIGMAED